MSTQKNLLVIPGHGAGDSGACGGGYKESDLARELATACKAWGGARVKRTAYSRNYYADNGVSRMKTKYKPSEWIVCELHLDCANGKAKGGHAIQGKSTATGKALGKAISGLLPGRADNHVINTALRNPRVGAQLGYDYTLLECGFIDNSHDREYVLEHMDEIAKAILKACGIPVLKRKRKAVCPW